MARKHSVMEYAQLKQTGKNILSWVAKIEYVSRIDGQPSDHINSVSFYYTVENH